MLSRRLVLVLSLTLPVALHAQGTLADYQRAHDLQYQARDLVLGTPGPAHWIGDSHHFWYAHAVKGGAEYMLVDADAAAKNIAFDHAKLADAVNKATGGHYTAVTLPFQPGVGQRPGALRPAAGGIATVAPLTFVDNDKAIQFGVEGSMYRCDLNTYSCSKTGPIPPAGFGRNGASEAPDPQDVSPEGPGGDPVDGLAWEPAQSQSDDDARPGRPARPCAMQPDRRGQASGQHQGACASHP